MSATASVYAIRRGQPATDPATTLHDETRGYTSSGIGHAECESDFADLLKNHGRGHDHEHEP